MTSVASEWYEIEGYGTGVYRLREKYIDPYLSGSIWLVIGSETGLVIDSGTGIVPPEPCVSTITNKPVTAVALCHYYDHAGGMYSFENRACHRHEADALANPARDWVDFNFPAKCKLENLPYPEYDIGSYARQGVTPTRIVDNEDCFDLGGRKLEVIHIPGRTPGSIALWEEKTGYLFGGESLFLDPENRVFPPEDVMNYEQSLAKLSKLPISTAFGGHYGGFPGSDAQRLISSEIGRYKV